MGSEIRLIPELPPEIVQAVNNDTLAVFIGAGVSRLVGCVGWEELAKALAERCLNEKIINSKEKESLVGMGDRRKVITICRGLLEKQGRGEVFREEMRKALQDDQLDGVELPNIYDELYKLRGVFVTTNVDRLFHRCFEEQAIHSEARNLRGDSVERRNLYHLHGCIAEPGTMVLGLAEYFERYGDNQKFEGFKGFLRTIFAKYTILFVGYGLEEFELLEYLFRKFNKPEGGQLRHLMLKPFFSGEERLLEFEQSYYEQMGIGVLGFQKDMRGYAQLGEVVKEWNRRLNQVSGYLHRSFKEIDDIVGQLPDENSQARLFQIIRNEKPLEDYAFRKLAESARSQNWLIPLGEKGYSSGDRNPSPREVEDQPGFFTVAPWNVLPYLEKVAEKNKESPDRATGDALVRIVDGIIDYRNGEGRRIENYRTDWFMVKIIFMLPGDRWAVHHIDFVGQTLGTRFGGDIVQSEIGKRVLPALIQNRRGDLVHRLLDVILGYREDKDGKAERIQPMMDEHWLAAALGGENREGIARLCGLEAVDIAIGKMRRICAVDDACFSYVWIPSIEVSSQTTFPNEYGSQLVSLVQDILEKQSAEDARAKVEALVQEEHSIFKRLAIHTIRHHWGHLGDLFWKWRENPLEEHELHHEVYLLLKEKSTVLSSDQTKQVVDWIEGIRWPRSDEPAREEYEARMRKGWLTALKDMDDQHVRNLIAKYDSIVPGAEEHPDFLGWHETGFVRDISPISSAKLAGMSNHDIGIFLKEWRQKDTWGLEIVSQTGLSDALKECVVRDPEKFAGDMSPFLDVDRVYQHDLLHGFTKAWSAKNPFSVNKVLDFIESVMGTAGFWEKEYQENEVDYRDWFVSEVAEFIEAGSRSDENGFATEHLPRIERILLVLAEKARSTVSGYTGRLTDGVLGSPRGRTFSAIVLYALRCARLFSKDKAERWPEAVKKDFTKRLVPETEPSLDYWVTLGKYLPNILYLDNRWVFENLDRIFPRSNEPCWRASFGAYVLYTDRVYEKVYSELKERGHYLKALETEFDDKDVAERVVQHICIGFLEDWERVDDRNSLIYKILELGNTPQLSEIVHFLGKLTGDEPRRKARERIKPLWQAMFALVETKQESPEYKAIIADLYLWLGIVDEIDDDVKTWTKLTAKHIRARFHESGLVEELAKHVEKTPGMVADIYIEMLDSGAYPDYNRKDIEKIVRDLYTRGCKREADTICNVYVTVGNYSLRGLYEEYNREGAT